VAQLTIAYATLYHTSATQVVLHWVTLPTSHLNRGSDVPVSPLIQPAFISVKWDSKKSRNLVNVNFFRCVRLVLTDLVFPVDARHIGGSPFHAEMIINLSRVDGRSSLRNQLRSSHGLTIPVACAIKGNLDTLCAARICRIFVRSIEIDVGCDIF
jgi:hypothetical protein